MRLLSVLSSRLRQKLASTLALCIYAFISLLVYWPASLLSNTQMVGGGVSDPAGQVSGLSLTQFAIAHGHNPFFTNLINYPVGINLAANPTAVPVAIITWPIEVLFGPVAGFNIAMCLGYFSAAVVMFFVLRSFLKNKFAAFMGGLIYGFSPYMVGQGLGHLAVLWTCLMPLIALLVVELFVRQRQNPRILGLLLGLVLALQAYLSVELLADAALVTLLVSAYFAIRHWTIMKEKLRYIASGSAVAVVVAGLLSSYLIFFELFGKLHLTGPASSIAGLNSFHSDLLGLIVPTYLQRYVPVHLALIGSAYASNNRAEDGIYVGLPLLVIVLGFALIWHKHFAVKVLSVIGLFSWILCLGNRLTINNHTYSFPLPWALMTHVPLLDGEIPIRYSLFVQLSVAGLLAVGIEQLGQRITAWRATPPQLHLSASPRQFAAWGAIVVILGAALIPSVPNLPLPIGPAGVPTFFTSSQMSHIPQDSVLLAYPYPQPEIYNGAQLWQAEANDKFKILGGYGVFLGPNGSGTPWPADLAPTAMQLLFNQALTGVPVLPGYVVPSPKVPFSHVTLHAMRIFLTQYNVDTIVIQPVGLDPALVVRYLKRVVGKPQQIDGLSVWFNVQKLVKQYA